MFRGLYVALVTPFLEDGLVNEEKLRELVDFHVEAGTHGLVPCGTTGETPAMRDFDQQRQVIEIVAAQARGRLQVIAGAGTNATDKTVANLKRLEGLKIDGALVVTPYYNKPTQAGLLAHFRAAAAASPVPIVMYNVPGRTGVNLQPETVARLAEEESIAAVKEAGGDLEQASWIVRLCGDRLTLLSGDDTLTLPMLAIGARGVISVAGNIVPQDMIAMIEAAERGDYERARQWHARLLPLFHGLFLETNPVPVKEALNILGFDVGEPRLPLTRMQPEHVDRLREILADYSLVRRDADRAASAPAAGPRS